MDPLIIDNESKYTRGYASIHLDTKLQRVANIVARSCAPVHTLGLYRLSPDAIMPTRATKHSACWDVYSIEDARLGETGGQWRFAPVRTGWRLMIPEGFRIDVRARSGLAAKQGVTVLNAPGTIDHDYEGELMIILGSLNKFKIDIKKGDRIAQIALERVQEFTVEEIDEADLPVIDSDRTGGLGSSGV